MDPLPSRKLHELLYFKSEDRYLQNTPSNSTKYTFFSAHMEHYSGWMDHMLGHKTSLNKLNIEIISSISSHHNGMKLEVNNRRKVGKFTNVWKLNSILLNSQWVKEEINGEILKTLLKQMKMKTQFTKTYGMQQRYF